MTLARTTTGSLRSNSQCCRTAAASIVGSSRAGGRHGGAAESLRIEWKATRSTTVPVSGSLRLRASGSSLSAGPEDEVARISVMGQATHAYMHSNFKFVSPGLGQYNFKLDLQNAIQTLADWSDTPLSTPSQRQGF